MLTSVSTYTYLHDTDDTYLRCLLYRCHTASPLQVQRAHTVGEVVAVEEAVVVGVGGIKKQHKVVRSTYCIIRLSLIYSWWY